ncbi:MAG TPA: hypothetical protein VIR15_09420 [Intrasporangium sp.]
MISVTASVAEMARKAVATSIKPPALIPRIAIGATTTPDDPKRLRSA